MKRIIIAMSLLISANAFAQTTTEKETPYIEVVGTAEKEVVPDEIFIRIVLRERYDGKEKITIDKQENDLKIALKNIGIDISKSLSLADADADYVKVKWNKKDVVSQKEFSLKVDDATTVGKVFQQLDSLKIKDADISKTNYSKLDSLKKEIRIEAIKNAKDKATYTLAAIGEQIGKPLIITDESSSIVSWSKPLIERANTTIEYSLDKKVEPYLLPVVEFEKMKVNINISTRFQIQ